MRAIEHEGPFVAPRQFAALLQISALAARRAALGRAGQLLEQVMLDVGVFDATSDFIDGIREVVTWLSDVRGRIE